MDNEQIVAFLRDIYHVAREPYRGPCDDGYKLDDIAGSANEMLKHLDPDYAKFMEEMEKQEEEWEREENGEEEEEEDD